MVRAHRGGGFQARPRGAFARNPSHRGLVSVAQDGGDRPDRNAPPTGGQGDSFDRRLRDLDKRLDAKAARAGTARQADAADRSGWATALKLSTEFVSAVLVGAALGFGLDWLLGTRPWGMIVLLLLGFAAGVVNVMRASGRMASARASAARHKSDRATPS